MIIFQMRPAAIHKSATGVSAYWQLHRGIPVSFKIVHAALGLNYLAFGCSGDIKKLLTHIFLGAKTVKSALKSSQLISCRTDILPSTCTIRLSRFLLLSRESGWRSGESSNAPCKSLTWTCAFEVGVWRLFFHPRRGDVAT